MAYDDAGCRTRTGRPCAKACMPRNLPHKPVTGRDDIQRDCNKIRAQNKGE
jgi:hypothetical protein